MTDMLSRLGHIRESFVPNGLTKIDRIGHGLTFSEILRSRLEQESGIKFSAHTVERLRERGITLSGDELERLSGAVNRAEEKGAIDSLVCVDNMAFIVSIKNRTVVTAMTGESVKDHVFTNIDSTVIA